MFALLAFAFSLVTPVQGPYGFWEDSMGSVIELYPCSTAAESDGCARVARVSPQAPESTDTKNPDASLRGRPLCGLVIGKGFHVKGLRGNGGQLYDPQSGKTYKGEVVSEGETLKLRGYVGIRLFGRTAEWHRVAAPPACGK